MKKIISIEYVENWKDINGQRHFRTYAILDDGTECVGYGKDFDIDDSVEVFYHKEVVKMQRKKGFKRQS